MDLHRTFLQMLIKYENIFNYTKLHIRLSPEVRTDRKLVEFGVKDTSGEKSANVIDVYLCGGPEETPERLTFLLAEKMATLVAPDKLQKLVLWPGRKEAERGSKSRFQDLVRGFPRYMNHKGVLELLERKIASSREMIDTYKLLYLLIEPAPRPVESVRAVSTGLISLIEHNVNSGVTVASQSPWENLRLMAVFSVIADKLEMPEIYGRCQVLLLSDEFCHNLHQLELADKDIPPNKGKSLEPDEGNARQRFQALFNAFWLTAEEYYDAATIPLPG